MVACSFPPAPDSAAAPAAAGGKPQTFETSGAIEVAFSRYGAVRLHTGPAAACSVRIEVDRGSFGDGPPQLLAGAAEENGALELSYPAPLIPEGSGRHVVTCSTSTGTSTAEADFTVPARSLDPRGFTIRIEPVAPTTVVARVTNRLDPSLVPARDAIAVRLDSSMADEWRRATRGLGSLTVVQNAADLVVHVLPGRGMSVHERSSDGTQRVLLYRADESGPVSADKAVGVALHELGHAWCCFGTDAGPDEHWLEKTADPQLVGVNQFGLMTNPVTCRLSGAKEICANAFSERELRAMGFADVPAPLADPCLTELVALTAELESLDARLHGARAEIDSRRGALAGIVEEMRSIETKYPSRSLPPEVRATYRSLSERYDGVYDEVDSLIKAYNADVDARNEIARKHRALPC